MWERGWLLAALLAWLVAAGLVFKKIYYIIVPIRTSIYVRLPVKQSKLIVREES
jgi:hypothetical protein